MSSNINPNNINGNFPVAGQDNDSQGFRDNFTNILNNFSYAANEITALQNTTNGIQLVVATNGNVSPYYANVAQSLIVNGQSNLKGDVSVLGNLTIAGMLYANTTVTVNQTEIVAGNITANGNLITSSITTAAGTGANLVIDPDGNADVIINAANVWLNAGHLRSTASTFLLANVYPSTANLFGNATSIFMGSSTGNVISRGGVTAAGYFYANGQNILSGVTGSYNNSNVAAYLPTYAGNITVGNISVNTNGAIVGNLGVTGNIVTGNLSTPVGGQITATVLGATGISIGGNINANGGNIVTIASTVTLFNTTATTVNAFGSATTMNIGNASGNTNVAGFLTVGSAIQFANLTTTQINAITPTNRGMTVYNYTTGNIQVYNGTKWANITLS